MADLGLRIVGARAVDHAASALVALELEVTSPAPVRALQLRCQVQIEPARRRYDADEARRLEGIFGRGDRFEAAQKPLLWAIVPASSPPFEARANIDLLLPCAPDMQTAPGTYLAAVADAATGGSAPADGHVPLSVVFSGTVFHAAPDGGLRVAPVPWSIEARFDLPVRVCREAIAAHQGDVALLAAPRPLLDRLQRFRVARALPGLDAAIGALLDLAETP